MATQVSDRLTSEVVHSIGRINYIEPNDLTTSRNGIPFPYEDYSMFVDLEVKLPSRNSCGREEPITLNYSTANGTLSLLGGTNGKLTTNYTDAVMNNNPENNTTECVGIESINISYDRNFVPNVNIKFVDARGLSFFSPQENEYIQSIRIANGEDIDAPGHASSLITALFMMPSPTFILRVKGFYGKTVALRLERSNVKVEFDNNLGNFVVNANFIGQLFGAYADIPMSYIILAPYLDVFGRDYWRDSCERNPEFRYQSGDGYENSLETFIEYKKSVASMSDYLSKDGGMHGDKDISEYKSQLNVLEKISEKIVDFTKDLSKDFNDSSDFFTTKEESYIKKIFIPVSPGKISENDDLYDKVVESVHKLMEIEKYKNLEANTNDYSMRFSDNLTIPSIFLSEENFDENFDVVSGFNLYVTRVKGSESNKNRFSINIENDGGKIPEGILSKDYFINYISRHESEIFANGSYSERIFFPDGFIIFETKDSFKDLQIRIDRCARNINSEAKDIKKGNNGINAVEILGFRPSIRNFNRMIFAHLETFAATFYECLRRIKDDKNRTVGYLGLSRTSCDIPASILESQTSFVPPFPVLYHNNDRQDSTRPEYFRPGETYSAGHRFDSSNYPEIRLVDSIYRAITKYSKFLGENSDVKSLSNSSKNKLPLPFLPANIGDFIFNRKSINPYESIFYDGASEDITSDALYIFALRMYSSLKMLSLPSSSLRDLTTRLSGKPDENSNAIDDRRLIMYAIGIGFIEAYNFFASHSEYDEKVKCFLDKIKLGNDGSIQSGYELFNDLLKNQLDRNKYPGTNISFVDNQGRYNLFEDAQGNSYVPLFFDSIGDLNAMENKTNLSGKSIGKWINWEEYDVGKAEDSGNTVFIIDPSTVRSFYSQINSNKHLTGFDTDNKFTTGNCFPIGTFLKPVNDTFFNKNVGTTSIFYQDQFLTRERMYGDLDYGLSVKEVGTKKKEARKKIKEAVQTAGLEWTNSVNTEEETSVRNFDCKVFNYGMYAKIEPNGSISNYNNWGHSKKPTVCNGFPPYDWQSREYDGDGLNYRKAYIFLWSISQSESIGYFRSNCERTKADLLREGAYYWRYNEFEKTGKEPLYFEKDFAENNKCRKDQIFVPGLDKFVFYPNYTDIKSGHSNLYNTVKNQGNFTLFSGGPGKFMDMAYSPDQYSAERKRVLSEYFMDWATGAEFKEITEAFETERKDTVSNVPVDIIFGGNSDVTQKGLLTLNFRQTIAKDAPILKTLESLLFDSYLFIDLRSPEINRIVPEVFDQRTSDPENRQEKRLSDVAFNSFIKNLKEFYNQSENGQKNYKNIEEEENNEAERGKDIRMSIYLTLKNIYERHFCGNTIDKWKLSSEKGDFHNFMYLDSYYNDIGNDVCLNVGFVSEELNSLVSFSSEPRKDEERGGAITTTSNRSILQYMSSIFQNSGVSISAFPLGNGMLSADSIKTMFTPNPAVDFRDFEDNYFLCLYPDRPSESLNLERLSTGYMFEDDSYLIADIAGSTCSPAPSLPETFFDMDGGIIGVPAFGVSYGKQNQSFFTNMSLNMDTFTNTEFSIGAEEDIAVKGTQGPRESNLYGQSIYNIYSNYGYTISVESMGNMQITPGMLFQLNNIPMFKGVYAIYAVEHTIGPGTMTTKFTGGRMKKYSVPLASSEVVIAPDISDVGIDVSQVDISKKVENDIENGAEKNEFLVYQNKILPESKKETVGKSDKFDINFSLYELIRSNTAISNQIANIPDDKEMANLNILVNDYLIPLNEGWAMRCKENNFGDKYKLRITSGFRTTKLQSKVNSGLKLSAHNIGAAADIVPENYRVADFYAFCQDYLSEHNMRFDQLLYESYEDNSGQWVHFGFKNPNPSSDADLYRGQCKRIKAHKDK